MKITAIITSTTDIPNGAKGAQLAAASHTAAIDLIEAIVAREKIECGFERLAYCVATLVATTRLLNGLLSSRCCPSSESLK